MIAVFFQEFFDDEAVESDREESEEEENGKQWVIRFITKYIEYWSQELGVTW